MGIPAQEWRNPRYRAFLSQSGKCVACQAMLRDPELVPGVPLEKLRPGMVAGYCDPCHGPVNGTGSKGPDAGCLTLCRDHHEQQHRFRWPLFQSLYGFDREKEAAAWFALFLVIREDV